MEYPDPFISGQWIDLTHDFADDTIVWPTSAPFRLDTVFAGYTDEGFYYESYNFSTSEHGGTHMDAPVHFAEGGLAAHEVPLDNLIGPAAVVDVSGKAESDRDYRITADDVTDWELQHNTTVDQHIILFHTGYGRFWSDARQYMGTDRTGEEGVAELRFPGIDPAAAEWLVENRNIRAVGLDTPSLDYGRSVLFETHQIFGMAGIPGFENVANLDRLPPRGASVVALPVKIRHGSGGPLRIVAHVPDENF